MEAGEKLRPPRWARRDSVAWGATDPATKIFTMFTPDGPWFAFDMNTCREVRLSGPVYEEPSPEEYVRQLHAVADRTDTRSLCYFIAAGEGPIKIGHSVDVEARLRGFQAGCPVKLRILATAPGGEAREAAYHWQFAEHRAHGEWFERHPDILVEIDRLNLGHAIPRRPERFGELFPR